ncbi:MAG: hypothetical protein QOG01_1917 [Pseudonocardiales bacterium]|jgi:hypothetical protein|nr:hypothetical protein [Pseudonocardiales bacterium]
MASPTVALIAMSALVAGSLWLSLRAMAGAELEVLPAHCRRRMLWWQRHYRPVYFGCAVAAAAAGVAQLVS